MPPSTPGSPDIRSVTSVRSRRSISTFASPHRIGATAAPLGPSTESDAAQGVAVRYRPRDPGQVLRAAPVGSSASGPERLARAARPSAGDLRPRGPRRSASVARGLPLVVDLVLEERPDPGQPLGIDR